MRESILDFTGMTEQHCFLIVSSTCFSSLVEDLKSIDIFMKRKNVSDEFIHSV